MTEALTAQIYFPYRAYAIVGSFSRDTLNDTDIETGFTGIEQRLARFPDPGYERFRLTTVPIRPEATLDAPSIDPLGSSSDLFADFLLFLKYCRGRLQPFYFVPPDYEFFINQSLGTYPGGIGGQQIAFRLPDKDVMPNNFGPVVGTGFYQIKIGGTTQVYGINYTAYNGNGLDNGGILGGITNIQWFTGTPAGAVTASFFGAKRYICRLDSDATPRKIFAPGAAPYYLQWDVTFKEVR